MESYKPNSHKSREEHGSERKRLDKVVSGTPRSKKKSSLDKVTGAFAGSEVRSFIIGDVLLPALKNTLWDIVTGSLDITLFEGRGRGGKQHGGNKISYRDYYDRKDDSRTIGNRPQTRTRFDYDDIIFDTRGEATKVLRMMDETIEEYGSVTVADMYDMAGLTEPYTANKYGWTTLRSAEIKSVRGGGFIIQLPPARPLS